MSGEGVSSLFNVERADAEGDKGAMTQIRRLKLDQMTSVELESSNLSHAMLVKKEQETRDGLFEICATWGAICRIPSNLIASISTPLSSWATSGNHAGCYVQL